MIIIEWTQSPLFLLRKFIHETQAEAASISGEQASQAMEEKYNSLAEAHGKLATEKERLQLEVTTAREDVTIARTEAHKLQTNLMQRDAELERRNAEVASLQRDRSSLDKLVQQRQLEIQELQTRLKAALDKVVALTEQNAHLEARFQEAQAASNRVSLHQTRLESEKEILERGNKWLSEELERKAASTAEERRKATEQILDLQQRLSLAELQVERLSGERKLLEQNAEAARKSADEACASLFSLKKEVADKETAFEKDLGLAQRMATIYKESAEDRSKRVQELEGIAEELKTNMVENARQQSEAIKKIEEARQAAEARLSEEKALREQVMAAAASGDVAALAAAAGGALRGTNTPPLATSNSADASSPIGAAAAVPAGFVGMTLTEAYKQYVDAKDNLRKERLKSKQLETLLDRLATEVEKRAGSVQEQKKEYERIKDAYSQLSTTLEATTKEKKALEAQTAQLGRTCEMLERSKRSLDQQVKDLGQQVSRLLHEIALLKTGVPHHQAGPSSPAGRELEVVGGNASAIVSQKLVEFADVEELQKQNAKLLVINRQLTIEAEASRAEAEAGLKKEFDEAIAKLSQQLEELAGSRRHAEDMLAQVVRQRDTLKELLHGVGGDLSAARVAYAQSVGIQPMPASEQWGASPPPGSGQRTGEAPSNDIAAGGITYREMYSDLESQFKEYRRDSSKTQEMLSQDLTQARDDVSNARSEAARAKAEAEFERDRASRLSSSMDMQRSQVESMMVSTAKFQELLAQTEKKLANAQAASEEAHDKVRMEMSKRQAIESELKIVAAAEVRASTEAAEISKEKFRLVAELEAARNVHIDKEKAMHQEATRLREDALKAQRELSEAQRELAVASGRAESAAKSAEVAERDRKTEVERIGNEIRELREALSSAQQRATASEARVDLLQEAVRKAEERAARLEMEKASRTSTLPSAVFGGTGDRTREAELETEVKLLRQELADAQEAAAAATGHAKQYESLASTGEAALKSVQAEHEQYKREATARWAAANEEVKRLRATLAQRETEMQDAKSTEREYAAEIDRLESEHKVACSKLERELEEAKQLAETASTRAQALQKEAEALAAQAADASKAYDNEVVAHGDALKRCATLEAAQSSLHQKLSSATMELQEIKDLKIQAESALQSQVVELENKLSEADRRTKVLTEQRDILQTQLERVATESSGGGSGGDFGDALRLLRQEREAAEINLHLAERELGRLRQEAAVARKAAEEARAQLSAETERTRGALREEADQAALVQKVEQFNLLRESNAALRADTQRAHKAERELQTKLRAAESQLAPLQARVRSLEAEKESAVAEVASAKEQAIRWQKRAQQMMQKYESVDQQEYQRVTTELEEAHRKLSDKQAALDSAQDQLKKQSDLLSHAQQRQQTLEKENKEVKSSVEQLKMEVQAARKNHAALQSLVYNTCNREKLPWQEWKVRQLEKERTLLELQEKIKAIENGENVSIGEIAAQKAQIVELTSQIRQKEEEIASHKSNLTAATKRAVDNTQKALNARNDAQNALKEAQGDIKSLKAELHALLGTLSSSREEQSVFKARIATLEAELATAKPPVKASDQVAALRTQAAAQAKSKLEKRKVVSVEREPAGVEAEDTRAAKKSRLDPGAVAYSPPAQQELDEAEQQTHEEEEPEVMEVEVEQADAHEEELEPETGEEPVEEERMLEVKPIVGEEEADEEQPEDNEGVDEPQVTEEAVTSVQEEVDEAEVQQIIPDDHDEREDEEGEEEEEEEEEEGEEEGEHEEHEHGEEERHEEQPLEEQHAEVLGHEEGDEEKEEGSVEAEEFEHEEEDHHPVEEHGGDQTPVELPTSPQQHEGDEAGPSQPMGTDGGRKARRQAIKWEPPAAEKAKQSKIPKPPVIPGVVAPGRGGRTPRGRGTPSGRTSSVRGRGRTHPPPQ